MDRRHLRWIVPAAGGMLAVVVSLVLVLQDSGEAACAFAPPLSDVKNGSASYYSTNRNGNCSLGPPSTDAYAAIGPAEYANGAACGSYLDVTGPNGATVRVQVVDKCPSCPPGKIDLSKAAFSRIGDTGSGIIAITYGIPKDPELPGPLKVRAKGGKGYSSLAVTFDNHGNRLASADLQTPAGWTPLRRNSDNTWNGPSGLTGPVTLRVADVHGHQVEIPGVTVGASAFQQTQVLMYSPAPSPSPSPSVSPSPSAAASLSPSASPSPSAPAAC